MNKYKGITLIELVVTFSLLLIIFSIGTFGYGYYNEVKNDLAIRRENLNERSTASGLGFENSVI